MNWESWLRSAAAPPSDNEDSKRQRTEDEIRDALSSYEGLRGRLYVVYAKGSYANNTNVRLNYDVDVAVEYRGYFYSDLMFDLAGKTDADVGVVPSTDPYTRAEFKADIRAALVKAYGVGAIEEGAIAYRVRANKTTLPADVVPSWEYRRYDRLVDGQPHYYEGSRVYPMGGSHRNNFPKLQLENGRAKNNLTGYRYKRMVRALKKLQTRLVDIGDLPEALPSYLTESLVYNVPNPSFNHATYVADMRSVLAAIFNATLTGGGSSEWHEVNELVYLFVGQSWTTTQVHAMASAAWDLLGFE